MKKNALLTKALIISLLTTSISWPGIPLKVQAVTTNATPSNAVSAEKDDSDDQNNKLDYNEEVQDTYSAELSGNLQNTELLQTESSNQLSRANIVHEGKSNNLTWSIDEDGKFLVEGTGDYELVSTYLGMLPPWWEERSLITTAEINVTGITNTSKMFSGCYNLTNLDISGLDTSQVTNMEEMFYECFSLTNLDLSNFDTSQVTNMKEMFCGCSSLADLDLNNFDTSHVTNTYCMFNGCSNLENLDLSSFDRNSITNMKGMFSRCSSLTSLDLSNFDTSHVIDMSYMFESCFNLANLNLSNFDTSNVTNMERMFFECYSPNFTDLDLSNFNTSNVKEMDLMFFYCENLKNLNLSSFDTGELTDMLGMFEGCSNLTNLDLSSFDLSAATDVRYIFENCKNLLTIHTPKNLFLGNASLPKSSSDAEDSKWYMSDGTEITELPVNLEYSVKLTRGSVPNFPELPEGFPKGESVISSKSLKDYCLEEKKRDFQVSFPLSGNYKISDGTKFVLREYDTYNIISYSKSEEFLFDKETLSTVFTVKFDPILPEDTKMYLAIENGELINNNTGEKFTILCKKNIWWFKTPKLIKNVWGFSNPSVSIDPTIYRMVFKRAKANKLYEENERDGKHGLCAGMVGTLMEFTQNDLKYTDFSKKGVDIRKIEHIPQDAFIAKRNMNVDTLIQLSYVLQFSPNVVKQEKKNMNNLKKLYKTVKDEKNVYIYIDGNVTHALWACDIEDFDDRSEIIVYDCNDGNEMKRIELIGNYPNFSEWKYSNLYKNISFVTNYPSAYSNTKLKYDMTDTISNDYELLVTDIEDFKATDSLGNVISKEQIYSSEQDVILPITVASVSEDGEKENDKTDMYWIQPDSILEATNTGNQPKELTFASNTQIIELDVPSNDTLIISADNEDETMDMQLRHNNDSEVTISYSYVTDDDTATIQITGDIQDTATIKGKNSSADIDGIDVNTITATYNEQAIEKKLDIPSEIKINVSVMQATDDTYLKITYDADNDGMNDTDLVDPIPFNPSDSKPATIPVTSLDVHSPEETMIVGSTVQLTTEIKPENATDKAVIWTSSDESTATVSSSGLVTALKTGKVTITVKLANGSLEKRITIEIQEKSEENKPGESKPEESKPDESKPEESKPGESKPEENKPENKPNESKPEESKPDDNNTSGDSSANISGIGKRSTRSSRSSSLSKSETTSNGIITTDAKKGRINSLTGIITGRDPGYSNWQQDSSGWKFLYADGTYATGVNVTDNAGGIHEQIFWEQINGAWYAFDINSYAKEGFVYDYTLPGWFYIDINKGMSTDWQFIDDKWYYFNPISDGTKGKMLSDAWIGKYYVNLSGVWEEDKK